MLIFFYVVFGINDFVKVEIFYDVVFGVFGFL